MHIDVKKEQPPDLIVNASKTIAKAIRVMRDAGIDAVFGDINIAGDGGARFTVALRKETCQVQS